MRARAVADGQQVEIPVPHMTELWGHVRKREPGMESPVQAGTRREGRKIRHAMGRRDVERKEVTKPVSHASRKAAIVLYVPVP